MYKYIIKRLIQLIPVILGVSLMVYFIISLAPGDPAKMIAGQDATLEELEAIRESLGLNQPLLVRYLKYMFGLLKGDLGTSYITGAPVLEMYFAKLPKTLWLAFSSTLVAMIISIPLGIYSALHQNTWKDNSAMIFALVGVSIPNFWLGLLLILLFALHLGWLPSGGSNTPVSVILPALTMGYNMAALMTRTTRSSMLDVIRQDYLMLARAKGVSERDAIWKHALKNAMIPIITAVGLQMGPILGGAVITEAVFAWPGIGRQVIDAINNRDIPTVTGTVIMTTIMISLFTLVVDIIYAYVDPRIKAQYTK